MSIDKLKEKYSTLNEKNKWYLISGKVAYTIASIIFGILIPAITWFKTKNFYFTLIFTLIYIILILITTAIIFYRSFKESQTIVEQYLNEYDNFKDKYNEVERNRDVILESYERMKDECQEHQLAIGALNSAFVTLKLFVLMYSKTTNNNQLESLLESGIKQIQNEIIIEVNDNE